MKKFVTSMLAVFLVMAIFLTGCSDKAGNDVGTGGSADGQVSGSTSAVTEAGTDQGTDANAKESGEPAWKTNNSPVTLTWYTGVAGYSKEWDAENVYVDKLITEETGVTVDFIHAGTDVNAQFNTMLASNNLPDLVTLDRWNSTSLIQTFIDSRKAAPMNKLIEEYAPTFKKIIPQSMIEWYTKADGNWYGFPNYFAAEELLEQYPEVRQDYLEKGNNQIYARKDIMDQLGITVEDLSKEDTLIEALKKVKNANVKYNGVTVVPLYFDDKSLYSNNSIGVIASSFGAVYEDEDGSYIDMRRTPEFKEALRFVNRLSREGLLDLENFTSDKNQVSEKMLQGAIFMRIGSIADYQNEVNQLYLSDPNAKYVPIPAIQSNNGGKPQFGRTLNKGWTLTFVSNDSEHKDRAIQFIEYLYSEHGQTVAYFGKEGETYKVTENGKYVKTDDVYNEYMSDWDAASKKWGMESIWWMCNDIWLAHVTEEDTSEQSGYINSIFTANKGYIYLNDAFDSGNLFDAIEPGSEEAKALQLHCHSVHDCIICCCSSICLYIWVKYNLHPCRFRSFSKYALSAWKDDGTPSKAMLAFCHK